MFQVDVMSRTPVYEQITGQVERYVAIGVLNAGDPLPSVRSLSVELSVNPNTIQKAFNELQNANITVSVPGKGSFISEGALDIIKGKLRAELGNFKLLAQKLAISGMSEEEICDCVRDALKERRQADDIGK